MANVVFVNKSYENPMKGTYTKSINVCFSQMYSFHLACLKHQIHPSLKELFIPGIVAMNGGENYGWEVYG